MVRPMPIIHIQDLTINPISLALAISFFVSISTLVSLCAKHARQVPTKCAPKDMPSHSDTKLTSKKLIIHKAAIPPAKKSGKGSPESVAGVMDRDKGLHEEGLWQKAILMGDKCRPPEFSGVIYYDYSGNRIPEMPRSPKVTPLRNFSSPMEKNCDSI